MMISDGYGYVGKRASATAKAAWAPQEVANFMISDGYVAKRASATAKAAWAPQEGANFKPKFKRLRMHMIQN